MKFLRRLLRKRETSPSHGGTDAVGNSPRTPWALLVSTSDDLCIVVRSVGRPVIAAAVVMHLDFYEPDGNIAPVMLALTYRDGETALIELGGIVANALSEIIVAPSILICLVAGDRIETMLPAAVFRAKRERPSSEQRVSPTGTVYAATVLQILSPGTAFLPWRAVVRLDKDGAPVAQKALVSLYPPPPLEVGMTTAILGTLEAPPEGRDQDLPVIRDGIQNPIARLAAFADPFHLEIALGTTTDAEEESVRHAVSVVLAAMAEYGALVYGEAKETFKPTMRPVGEPPDPQIAAARPASIINWEDEALAAHNSPNEVEPQPLAAPGAPRDQPILRIWGIFDAPGHKPAVYFERVSDQKPVSAALVMHDLPLVMANNPESPFSMILTYGDGSTRTVVLAWAEDEIYDRIRTQTVTRIIEIDGEKVGFDYHFSYKSQQ